MIPRNSLHRTTLQQITKKSKKSDYDFRFEGNKLIFKSYFQEYFCLTRYPFRPLQRDIQKHKWKGIQSFGTDYKMYMLMEDETQKLANLFAKELASVETLDFHFNGNYVDVLKEKSLEALGHRISRNCKNLKSIKLVLRLDENKVKGLPIFFKELVSGLKNIKTLSLEFQMSQEISIQKVQSFSRFLGKNCFLRELSISFNRTFWFGNEALKALARGLNPGLEKLSLEFEKTTVGDEGVEELTKKIGRKLQSLKSLRLYFEETCIREEGIRSCVNHLVLLKEILVDLDVRFPQVRNLRKEFLEEMNGLYPENEVGIEDNFFSVCRRSLEAI